MNTKHSIILSSLALICSWAHPCFADGPPIECGTDETINKSINPINMGRPDFQPDIKMRINHCRKTFGEDYTHKKFLNKATGQTVDWYLVSRKGAAYTGKYYEVWLDLRARTLWSDTIDDTAQNMSVFDPESKAQTRCHDEEGFRAKAEIEKAFKLPLKAEFEEAGNDGFVQALPNAAERGFWASESFSKKDHDYGWVYNTYDNQFYPWSTAAYLSVRCAAHLDSNDGI